MTRELRDAIARTCEALADADTGETKVMLLNAAAELRKSCATCQHFDAGSHTHPIHGPYATCNGLPAMNPPWVPADGSGFCHAHEPKEEK